MDQKNLHRSFKGIPFQTRQWLVALAALLGTWPAAAQHSTNADIRATATVVRTLAVVSTSDLNFGTFAPGQTAGAVSLTADGRRSSSGGVLLVAVNSGKHATVSLAGTPGTSYGVTLPSSVQLSTATGSASMTLAQFTTTLTGSQGQLGAQGTDTFGLGGTLAVNANQLSGSYSGKLTLTVHYN